MAWLVENLIRNSYKLKEDHDLESDDYNNYLILETKIKNLHLHGVLSEYEMSLIQYVADGYKPSELEKILNRSREFIATDIKSLTDKIAFSTGDIFTDAGCLAYMEDKYKLTEEQVQKLEEYMAGKLRNKLIRKTK